MARGQYGAGMVEGLLLSRQDEGKETQGFEGTQDRSGNLSRQRQRGVPPVSRLAIEAGEGVGARHTGQVEAAAHVDTAAREPVRQFPKGVIGHRQQHPPLRSRLMGEERGAVPPSRSQRPSRVSPPQD